MSEQNQTTQTELEGVIDFLEHVQQITTDDIATFCKEIESPHSIHNNEASQRHFKMLLAEAHHEIECLDVVIAKLKEELEWEFREVVISFEHPKPSEHIETDSQEYDAFYSINGPHIQCRVRLDDLLRKANLGCVDDWYSPDGDSYYIVVKGVDDMALKETILKTLAENDHGLQDIEVITQTEQEEAECDADPQEEKDHTEKERQAECGDIEDMLAVIRKRRAELKEEEYATKMLDGAHARMEQARQMNEQGELK